MDTLERVKKILSETLDIDISEINDDVRIVDDLGADSLDICEISIEIENEFSIKIDDQFYSSVKSNSVRDVADAIDELMNRQK